jgi:hypothetical protein
VDRQSTRSNDINQLRHFINSASVVVSAGESANHVGSARRINPFSTAARFS